MANLAEKLVGAGLGYKAAKDQQKAAREAAAQRLNLIKSLDFTPAYASDLAPAYKRTESPVARSWIESFLSGNNPSAINPTSPNAGVRRQQAQQQQNAMFGTPQDRVARQRQLEQETPWAVTSPTRTIGAPPAEKAQAEFRGKFENPGAVERSGFTPDLDTAIHGAFPDAWDGHNAAGTGALLVHKYGSSQAAIDAINRQDPWAMKQIKRPPIGA